MNAEVAYAYRERKVEAEPLGEQAYHLRALQHLKLKTVVKVGCHSRFRSLKVQELAMTFTSGR